MQSLSSRRAFTSSTVGPRLAAQRRQLVVVAAKPTKAADFRLLTEEQISEKIVQLHKEAFTYRALQRTGGIQEFKAGVTPGMWSGCVGVVHLVTR